MPKASSSPFLLVADDDPDDLLLLFDIFGTQNPATEIRHFSDGQQILDFLAECRADELPAAILLDYKMPIVTGAQVLAVMERHSRLKPIPKFVWSSSENSQFVKECLGLGALRYFIKPNSVEEMEEIVSHLSRYFSAGE